MLNKEQVVELLREQSAFLASEFGIRKIGLFGSFAKGHSSDKSDIRLVPYEKLLIVKDLKFHKPAERPKNWSISDIEC